MKHLSDAEIVDLIEKRAGPEQVRHAETCSACHALAEALGAVLALARRDEVPEPSPLFWDDLSARVSKAIDHEAAPSRWTWLGGTARYRFAAAAAAALLAAGLTWQLFPTRDEAAPPASASEQPRAESQLDTDGGGFVDAWDALEAVAQDLDWEDAQSIGIASRPGSTEPLVGDLTDDERDELARLIEEEIRRHGA